MKKQFENLGSRYGAPMGRPTWNEPPTKPHSVRVFKVMIDSQGYDDGGAYWGTGKPLYCATDGANYRQFTRADTRLQAIAEFRLPPFLLRAGAPEFKRLKSLENRGCISAAGVQLLQKLESLGYGA